MTDPGRETPEIPGRAESLWIATTPETDYPPLPGGLEVDVAIIGGGIAGLTTALLLKEAGRSVAVIEAGRIAAGVTGHTTAKVTSLHRLIYRHLIDRVGEEKARLYGEANQAAIETIDAFVRKYGITCDFARRPAYTFARMKQSLDSIHGEVDAAKRLGLPATFVDDLPLPINSPGAVLFDNQAEFHPRKYLLGLAGQIDGDGSSIFEQTRVVDVKEGNPCTVVTDRGEVTAGDVVLATHFPIIDKPGSYFARMRQERSYILGLRIDEPFPDGMFISAEGAVVSLRSQPTQSGDLVLIGGGNHATGVVGHTEARYRMLEGYARTIYTVRSVEYRWSTQDTMPADRIPYIGLLAEGHEHLYVATGFGKWGMTNGTAAGMILTDLLLGSPSPWGEVFDPARFEKRPQPKEEIREWLGAAGGTVEIPGDILDAALSQLGNGSGIVLQHNEQKVAVYRDTEGRIHSLDPTCMHMACQVSWNDAERSWDCPCHGSRYDALGRVIESPTVNDLKQKEIRRI
ncbi:FAD-dependent oxidoreductase [Methanoculleus sp. FWC-SCC1]|uniref:FAD-dependent oxidoreductase n=1 Tax=Methanoculleus frigidifontis TaxID=2584085 RepID=A0ABT8M5V7_9EURY|nr:FAD-dependent oxidoreductase [Methanoculleus sp. FWC-SCC1]MDN7023323.1 FAD-dependent oxidoreductase [Methanoculleus sp. FWC-SCC1]